MATDDKIQRLYGHYGYDPQRATMYLNLADHAAETAQALARANEFNAAIRAADKAREYREAASLITSLNHGAGI